MSETVKRYEVWIGDKFYGAFEKVVLAADYARLEQECKDAQCRAELIQRAAEVFREERDAALKQVEGLRALLCRIAGLYAALMSDCGLSHAELMGEIEEAMRAKP